MENALSSEEREIAYMLGYECYDKGEFRKAKRLFMTLVFADPYNGLFWKGFASSLQMQERYEEAAQAWAMAAFLNASDPLPHFHAAECLLAVDQEGEATKALACAEERLTKKDKELKNHITKLITWIRQKSV